jgi:hypothetical protein
MREETEQAREKRERKKKRREEKRERPAEDTRTARGTETNISDERVVLTVEPWALGSVRKI